MTERLWRVLLLVGLHCVMSSLSTTHKSPAPPSHEQGVTFSHVYKIDIPGGSGCKLESVPSDGTGVTHIYDYCIRIKQNFC